MRRIIHVVILFALSGSTSIAHAADPKPSIDLRRVALVGDAAVRLSKLADATAGDATTGTGAVGVDFVTKFTHTQVLYVLGTARSVSGLANDEAFGRSLLLPNSAPNSFMLDIRTNFHKGLGAHAYLNASGSDWTLDLGTKDISGNANKTSTSVFQMAWGVSATYQLNLTELMVPATGSLPDIQLIFDIGYSQRIISGNGTLINSAIGINGRVFHGFEPTIAFQLNIFRFFASVPVFSASADGVSVAGLDGAHFVVGVGINGPLVALWSKDAYGKAAVVRLDPASEDKPRTQPDVQPAPGGTTPPIAAPALVGPAHPPN